MKYELENKTYEVIIIRKHIKNTYIRFKDDEKIYVTTNALMPNIIIKKLLDKNYEYLLKRIKKINNSNQKESDFYLFGKKYKIVFMDTDLKIIGDTIYVKNSGTLKKWMEKETRKIFEDRLKVVYNLFEEKIPFPNLKIRKMQTRWGVCNRKTNTITINSNLIREELNKIDYVMIHELSHFVHFNHSKEFWIVVNKYAPEYKKIKKELKS